MDSDEFLLPPGCKCEILPHPSGKDEVVELAIFQDHRFAFFFWLRWKLALGTDSSPPALVSLDWHEDLAAPDGSECDELKALPTDYPRAVSLFCWEKLNPLNDGHILSTAYLNLIGDIYVVRKQAPSSGDNFQDVEGRTHRIRCFPSIDELMTALRSAPDERIFFDIDLDYFTESPDHCGGGAQVSLASDQSIKSTLDPHGELMSWLFPRISGMTIATEPEFCGGLINSNHLLSIVTECLFYPQLMGPGSTWRHLQLGRND